MHIVEFSVFINFGESGSFGGCVGTGIMRFNDFLDYTWHDADFSLNLARNGFYC